MLLYFFAIKIKHKIIIMSKEMIGGAIGDVGINNNKANDGPNKIKHQKIRRIFSTFFELSSFIILHKLMFFVIYISLLIE
jgi:hypothetical protein